MLSREDNELLSRVGPGTAMGKLMRRYWTPALLSSEIEERDGAPVRVRLLGERLVAFRDSAGRVGLLEEYCAHRLASLFLGRNELGGIRCVYHGWKYDVTGRCVEMPTEHADSPYKSKIRLQAYPTVELGGVVWAYLGGGTPPALPKFEWTQLRPEQRIVSRTWQECNWLQALEGGIDSMHASMLHTVVSEETKRAGLRGLWTKPVVLRDEVVLTSYGHAYGSVRPFDEHKVWAKLYHYVMPFHTFFPFELGGDGQRRQQIINGHIFVPMDDENTMTYNWIGKYGDEPFSEREKADMEWSRGRGRGEIGPDHRKARNVSVDWLIDRKAQKAETFSGIDGINTQDHAIQESMGPIVDRTREHLGTTDAAIMATRRLLLKVIKRWQPDEVPPGILPTYYRVRATEQMLQQGGGWKHMLRDVLDPAEASALAEQLAKQLP
ncbi:MAG: Rieske 2Fe-2S domain-containing protein [Betaproteobacteria bacterium]